MTDEWEPGTECSECPHPLSEHRMEILERVTLVVCQADMGDGPCDCIQEHEHAKTKFNQTAIDALGVRNV